jgi:L-lysine exporter family protein LysE/ArgO
MIEQAVFWKGLALGASLIIAIGAQNAFVLRQGLRREHVVPVVLVCAVSDALLISAGIAGMGAMVRQSPLLLKVVLYGGAAFLVWYGVSALRRAARPRGLHAAAGAEALSWRKAVATALAFTYLNPHVYLDTVVLLGGIGGQQPAEQRVLFAVGAMTASFFWFFGLGFGARLLAPALARPSAWRVLDASIGAVMLWLALSLLADGIGDGGVREAVAEVDKLAPSAMNAPQERRDGIAPA